MAGFDYVRSRATADRLITKFGKTTAVVIRRTSVSGPAHDPEKTTQDFPCIAAIVSISIGRMGAGSLIQIGDERALVSAGTLSLDLQMSDKLVTSDGVERSFVKIDPLKPGDVNVLWDTIVRR